MNVHFVNKGTKALLDATETGAKVVVTTFDLHRVSV